MSPEQVIERQLKGVRFAQPDVEGLLAFLVLFFDHYNAGEDAEATDCVGEVHAQMYRMGITMLDEMAEVATRRRDRRERT